MSQNELKIIELFVPAENKKMLYTTGDHSLLKNDKVVIETALGLMLATITDINVTISSDIQYLPAIIRRACYEDIQQDKQNKLQALLARGQVAQCIKLENLQMSLVEVIYSLDRQKLFISYLSDQRVDFRDLLKRLVALYPCRIELRQIGQRDQAKIVGGLANCGRLLCCHNHLNSFETISISLAKMQMLTLNSDKLSGQCGKLKCCLRYENNYYEEARQHLPALNSKVSYNNDTFYVNEINILNKTFTLSNKEQRITVSIDDFYQQQQQDNYVAE